MAFDQRALQHNLDRYDQLWHRLLYPRFDHKRILKENVDTRLCPFNLQNLKDFGTYISKLHFVFNISDELLKDNRFYHQKHGANTII